MSKVLVVEDDRVSRRVLAAILDQAGHEAVLAESIAEARQRLDEHVLVDLMILDNQLGRDWGWELLRDLRKHPVYKALPVVVYTAFTDRSSVVRFVEFGVQGLRVKPYQGMIILEDVA